MAEATNRDQYEAELARALGRAYGQIGRAALDAIVSAGNPAEVALDWDAYNVIQYDAIAPILTRVYEDYLAVAASQMGGGPLMEAALVAATGEWAAYIADLVAGLQNTSADGVARIIADYFAGPQSIGELTQRLTAIFGPTRAENIARTEITRASVAAERALAQDLQRRGVKMKAVWNTNADETVCRICRPLNGVKLEPGLGYLHKPSGTYYSAPPAHPRCRCWENWSVDRG